MATYKIDSSLLTAQADEIRTLNGTTATMNPSQMTTALQSANAEVATQEQKIIEITEMLQGKAMGGSGEDVTDEVTAQTELIADLESAVNALPEAGSGGGSGGGVETCTVTVTTESQRLVGYLFSTYVNGAVGSNSYLSLNSIPIEEPLVIENVICGSSFFIKDKGDMFDGATITGGAEMLTYYEYDICFQAPASAGECTIHLKQD